MAKNGLNRYIKEAELFRRYLRAWQEVIEISEEIHQIAQSEEMKETVRAAISGTKQTQQHILVYLRQSNEMFAKLDEALGELPGGVK